MGNAAYPAYTGVVQLAWLQSVPAPGHGSVIGSQIIVRSSQLSK